MGVDDGRNAVIGGANQRQSQFDGADLGLAEMLIGARRVAEPGIVGDVDDEIGAPRLPVPLSRKDDLVADERQRRGAVRQFDGMPVDPGGELARQFDQLVDPQPAQQALEGNIFAEGHEMELVHRVRDLAGIVDRKHGIVEAGAGAGPALGADGAGEEQLSLVQRLAQLGQPISSGLVAPLATGERVSSIRWLKMRSRTALSHFSDWSITGWTIRTSRLFAEPDADIDRQK